MHVNIGKSFKRLKRRKRSRSTSRGHRRRIGKTGGVHYFPLASEFILITRVRFTLPSHYISKCPEARRLPISTWRKIEQFRGQLSQSTRSTSVVGERSPDLGAHRTDEQPR